MPAGGIGCQTAASRGVRFRGIGANSGWMPCEYPGTEDSKAAKRSVKRQMIIVIKTSTRRLKVRRQSKMTEYDSAPRDPSPSDVHESGQ